MKAITAADLMNYRFLSRIKHSPDGKYAAFLVNHQNRRANTYEGDLFLWDVKNSCLLPFTETKKEKFFVWDTADTLLCTEPCKNGTSLIRRSIHKKGKSTAAFHFDAPLQAMTPICPGESYLVTLDIDTNQNPDWNAATKKDEADYIRISELPFWDNGIGYVSGHRDTLFLYSEKENRLDRLTAPLFNVSGSVLSADKTRVYYTGQEYSQKKEHRNGLFVYDFAAKTSHTIIPQGTLRIDRLQLAGDKLYFSATTADQHGNCDYDDWYLCDIETLKWNKIAENDFTIGCNVSSDCRYGGGASTGEQNSLLLYLTTERDVCGLNLLTANGEKKPFPKFEGAIDCFSAHGDSLLLIAMENGRLQELYSYDASNGYQCLTNFNGEALKGRYVAHPEYIGFTAGDGEKIDGWLLKPINFDPSKQYPGVLSIHGGPCVAWGSLFVHEMQLLAASGYFVFFCNPRGSDGRGAAFADLRGKYGQIDFSDFMGFTDHVCKITPQLDSQRLGAIGGSYGGYMANWIVGHTDRFGAIVSQRSFCNPISDFGVSCIGYSFDAEEFQATPWSDVNKLWEHAPLKYACDAKTPTLFIHSLEDYNCPLTQGFEMFSALKYHGVEAEMCLFKGENHELSRSGKPRHRLKRLSEICRWLDGHLKA